jgi:hypothetical protein
MLFEGIIGIVWGILRDFPPKMVPAIFLLKSGLFSLGWQPCGDKKKNHPVGKDPRISKFTALYREDKLKKF